MATPAPNAQKIFNATKSTVRLKYSTEANQRDGGGEQHLIAKGQSPGGAYSSYIAFQFDWSDVKRIISAVLVVQTIDHNSHGAAVNNSDVKISKLTKTFPTTNSTKSEGEFVKGNYDPIPLSTTAPVVKAEIDATNGLVKRIGVTSLVEWEAPAKVLTHDGHSSKAHGHYGWRLERNANTTSPHPAVILASEKHPLPTTHPYIELNYIAIPQPGQVVTVDPAGSIPGAASGNFEADYQPSASANVMSSYTIELYEHGKTTAKERLWTITQNASAIEVANNEISLPLSKIGSTGSPYALKTGVTYTWRINVKDNKGTTCPWSAWTTFSISTVAPTLSSPTPAFMTYDTLTGVNFGARYTDPTNGVLTALRYRFLTLDGDLIWDTDLLSPTDEERTSRTILRLYAGPALAAGDYTWDLRAYDEFGAESNTVGGSFTTLTDETPDPGDAVFLTGYNRQRRRTRIVIRKVNTTNRGPGTVVAIIEDGSNIGASEFYNSGGEFFFTLPAVHPQVPAIEPRQTHYALEQYRGQGWVEVTAGLIVDADARGDDIIFYGYDYLGIFGMLIDERFNPNSTADKAADLWKSTDAGGTGTKYNKVRIDAIVKDQMDRAIHAVNSPLGFMTVGTIAVMTEVVTIFTTFRERGPFVTGLLDSHRAGKGKYTRIRVRKTAAGGYQFVVTDSDTKARPALRMEYGGLVQDFRIVMFGAWATGVHAVGVPVAGTETIYAKELVPAVPADLFPKRYGSYPKAQIYENITDANDLTRRARQTARSIGKLGKRLSIGLRQDVLDVKDGWDITDSIPIHIDRGAVDTLRMGSGYWTILGWSWQVRPDGYRNLTLTIQPRDDTTAPQADLIESKPIFTGPEWKVGIGPPTQESLGFEGSIGKPPTTYIDSSTGEIYQLNTLMLADWEPDSGDPPPYVNVTNEPGYSGVVVATEDSFTDTDVGPTPPSAPNVGDIWIDNSVSPSVSYIWDGTMWVKQAGGEVDTVPPPVPVIKGVVPTIMVQPDGTTVSGMYVTVGYNAVGGTEERMFTAPPGIAVVPASDNFTLGMEFTVTADGFISAVRYYHWGGCTATTHQHMVSIWHSGSGTRLAGATDSPPAGFAGWREVALPVPLTVHAGDVLRASYTVTATVTNYGYSTATPASAAPHLTVNGAYFTAAPGENFPAGGAAPAHFSADVVYQTGTPSSGGVDDLAEIVVAASRAMTATTPPVVDWTMALQRFVASADAVGGDTIVVVSPVVSGETYQIRAAATDISGNRSDWSTEVVRVEAVPDTEPPPRPDGVVVESGMSTLGVQWNPIAASDFSYTEVQWRRAAFAGAPEIPADPDADPPVEYQPALPPYPEAAVWNALRTGATVVVITGLDNGDIRDPKVINVRVRSVDQSGNTLHDTGTPDGEGNPVTLPKRVDEPGVGDEWGWVTKNDDGIPLTGAPSALPGNALIWTKSIIEQVFAGEINATWVTTGVMRLGNAPPLAEDEEAGPVRIEVYDLTKSVLAPDGKKYGNLIGRWAQEGIEVMNPANDDYKMVINDASLIIYRDWQQADETAVVTINPLGIDAASIRFGTARGGHNLIQNSSFELGSFATSVIVPRIWDLTAHWAASRVGTDTNITPGDVLTMTVI